MEATCIKLPKIVFSTLGSRMFNKTVKKKSVLKIIENQKEYRGYGKAFDHILCTNRAVDGLGEFSRYIRIEISIDCINPSDNQWDFEYL